MNLILDIPRIISKYFAILSKDLSRKMREVLLYYVTALYLEHKRFNITQVSKKAPFVEYFYQRRNGMRRG
jgi:hypothetical protein